MEARAFAGDRLTALRVFEEWKTKLSEAWRATITISWKDGGSPQTTGLGANDTS